MAKGQEIGNSRHPAAPAGGELPPGVKLLRTLAGHEGPVCSVAFAPDGRTLASGSRDRTVKLWETATGRELRTLMGHHGRVLSVAFAPDGRTLASGSGDETVKLWKLPSGRELRTLSGHRGPVSSVAWAADGRTLASGSDDRTVKLWELPGGRTLASGDDDRTVKLYEFPRDFWIGDVSPHRGPVWSVTFAPDGCTPVSGSSDGMVKLWEVESERLLPTLTVGLRGVVSSVAFAPDGRTLVSASDDGSVKLCEPTTGRLLRTLEGHTEAVLSVLFSPDGRLLASTDACKTTCLWSCLTWELVAVIRGRASDQRLVSAAFHPNSSILARTGSPDGDRPDLITLWELDLDVLLHKPAGTLSVPRTVHYVNAKVVLIGDTGVGKSGLAERLVHRRFVPTESSHARRAHVLEAGTVRTPQGGAVHRETLLWDLAGQPAYRLVHQLSMDDAALACILFDARSETKPLEGAAYWSQVLDQARTNTPLAKLLVASRMDVGGLPASQERIGAFAREHGFEGFFATSAKTGEGCDALLEAIRQAIPWEDMPTVTTTETLAAMREFVARLKGEKEPPVKDAEIGGKVPPMLTIARLHGLFESHGGKPILLAEFIAHLERLEATDAVDLLLFHTTGQEPQPEDQVLLDPTRVDAYASALLVAARDEPDGPGHLLESRVREGQFKLPEGERLGDRECEKHLLWYVMESLFARDLALRERIKGQDYVVFPSQCTAEMKFPGAGMFGVAFGMAGPVRSIYATLIAQLAHYEGFKKREFFLDAAAYRAEASGCCFLRLRDHADGTAELHVSFDDETQPKVRQGFLEFVGQHLEARCVPGSVTRRHAYHCRSCKSAFEDRIVKARLENRKKSLLCPLCEKRTPLVNLLAPPTKAGASVAQRMDVNARVGRKRITAAWVIQGKEAQGKYDVFLSHNTKDKPAVERIAKKFKSVGIRPWFDKWDLAPGDTIADALEKAIKSIPCAALCFGPADKGNWHLMEIRAYVEAWAKEEARFIPVILPGVKEMPELPIWVRQTLWVDMRAWKKQKSDAFYRLVCGILGRPPGEAPMAGFSARRVLEWQDACL